MADWVEEQIVKHEWSGNVDNISYGQILVRCKDCKKRNSWECWQYFFGRIKIPEDWYCADGERKEG